MPHFSAGGFPGPLRGKTARNPEPQNCPKWLGEGAKGVLVYADQKRVALVQKEVCTGTKQGFALVQETFGETILGDSFITTTGADASGAQYR